MNVVNIIGRLVRDPEVKFTPQGRAVANFTVAVDKGLSKEKKAEFEQRNMPTADFIPIVVWGKQAEHCQTYLAKGRLVAINGSIQTRTYQAANGEKRYITEVLANNVEFIDWGDRKPAQQQQYQPQSSPSTSSSLNDYDYDSGFTAVSDDDDVPF